MNGEKIFNGPGCILKNGNSSSLLENPSRQWIEVRKNPSHSH
jgi:hypothetical protein